MCVCDVLHLCLLACQFCVQLIRSSHLFPFSGVVCVHCIQLIERQIPQLEEKLAYIKTAIEELRPEVVKLQEEYDEEVAAAAETSASAKKRAPPLGNGELTEADGDVFEEGAPPAKRRKGAAPAEAQKNKAPKKDKKAAKAAQMEKKQQKQRKSARRAARAASKALA